MPESWARKQPTAVEQAAWWDVLPVALVVCDGDGRTVQWAMAAQTLLGYRPDEVVGRYVTELLLPEDREAAQALSEAIASGRSVAGSFPVRHRNGSVVDLEVWTCPAAEAVSDGRGMICLAADARAARRARGAGGLLDGLFARSPVGLAVFDTELRFEQVNPALEAMNGVAAAGHLGRRLVDVLPGVNAEQMETAMRRVLDTGEAVVNFRRVGRTPATPDLDRVWACSYFRLDDPRGRPLGVSASIIDITAHQEDDAATSGGRARLELLNDAALRVGTTLDVARTGQELADVAVPRLADIAAVDVLAEVIEAADPLTGLVSGAVMRRLGKAPARASTAADALAPVGATLHFPIGAPYAQSLIDRRPYLLEHFDAATLARAARHTATPGRLHRLGVHSMMMVPLIARGFVLGVATLLRGAGSPAFGPADLTLAGELAARAALSIDNARLYHREHDTALILQRSMLPRHLSPPQGMEIAHCYQPASDVNEVGGDWYDVVPLGPGTAALVIGDVMGHGITAAAAMGQIRTAVRSLAHLGLPPDQVLSHLERTVQEIDDAMLATCLYAVCDATTGHCRLGCAGHPPPVLITPGGTARLLGLPPGAPLGIGDIPYVTTDVVLPPGSVLVLFTDGLIETRGGDLDQRLRDLTGLLSGGDHPLDRMGDTLLGHFAPAPAQDDIAVLLARIGRPSRQ
ncbi:SpoIIE family protein phosphatase [Streptomyces sp. NPDC003719]